MPKEGYFTKGALGFLTELQAHNTRDWFQANKERFEGQVRDPFLRLIADLAPGLKKIAPGFVADPSTNGGSMMRIYRDIRFSKDKSPYKTYVAAHFWHAKGREGAAPAFYVHIEPGASVIGGGIWRPEPSALKKIRNHIVADPDAWRKATSGQALGSACAMGGESLRRPPPGYDLSHPLIEDIKRKDFVISAPAKDSEVSGLSFKDVVLARLRSVTPFVQFLSRAVGLS
jgi:uncharacterized protein (TIGR02453 family)